jgi:hypothetical protein
MDAGAGGSFLSALRGRLPGERASCRARATPGAATLRGPGPPCPPACPPRRRPARSPLRPAAGSLAHHSSCPRAPLPAFHRWPAAGGGQQRLPEGRQHPGHVRQRLHQCQAHQGQAAALHDLQVGLRGCAGAGGRRAGGRREGWVVLCVWRVVLWRVVGGRRWVVDVWVLGGVPGLQAWRPGTAACAPRLTARAPWPPAPRRLVGLGGFTELQQQLADQRGAGGDEGVADGQAATTATGNLPVWRLADSQVRRVAAPALCCRPGVSPLHPLGCLTRLAAGGGMGGLAPACPQPSQSKQCSALALFGLRAGGQQGPGSRQH